MRWYDYLVCIWLADVLAAGLIHSQWFILLGGLITYISYERMRLYGF